MAEKNNVYIIGMMGVGKTTITNELKKLTKRTCVDIDELIVKKTGISIPEIFSKFGENYFRKLETDVLEELSNKMNLLVSCGGGIIVNDINIDLMHKSGKVIWLHRDMEKVIEDIDFSSRPLLQKNKTKIFDIFEQRKEKYESASDIKIDNCTTIENTVKKIISLKII